MLRLFAAAIPANFVSSEKIEKIARFATTSPVLHREPSPMATPFIVGIGALTGGILLRQSLRNAAQSGTKLPPLLAAFAGTGRGASAGLKGDWVIGGFQSKMDKKEAGQILGLK